MRHFGTVRCRIHFSLMWLENCQNRLLLSEERLVWISAFFWFTSLSMLADEVSDVLCSNSLDHGVKSDYIKRTVLLNITLMAVGRYIYIYNKLLSLYCG